MSINGKSKANKNSQHKLSEVTAAFLEHNTFLKKFLSSFVRSEQDIEDMAQEAYLRAYVAEQKQAILQPKAFLFRVAKNLALTGLTKKANQITTYLEEAGVNVQHELAHGADVELEAQQSLGLYCEAAAKMPEKARQVFLLRKVHGLTHKKIAERMSLSVPSVEKYLYQGMSICQAHVHEQEGVQTTTNPVRRRGRE